MDDGRCVACRIKGHRPTTIDAGESRQVNAESISSSGHNALNAKFEGPADKTPLSAFTDDEISDEHLRRLRVACDSIKVVSVEW